MDSVSSVKDLGLLRIPYVICITNSINCAACIRFRPHFTELAKLYAGIIQFVTADIYESPELIEYFDVSHTPSVYLVYAEDEWYVLDSRTSLTLKREIDSCLLEHL